NWLFLHPENNQFASLDDPCATADTIAPSIMTSLWCRGDIVVGGTVAAAPAAAGPGEAARRGAGLGDRRLAGLGRGVGRRLRPDRLDDGLGGGVPDRVAAAGAGRAGGGRAGGPLGPAPDHGRGQPGARGGAAAAAARRRRGDDLGRLPGAGPGGGRRDAV